jgi:PKD repeat protein
VVTKRLLAFAAVLVVGGCALDKQGPPSLTGPSEFALSMSMTATPDIITQDGVSTAVVQVTARDATNQPVRGLSIRVETAVNGVIADFGTLSSRVISTDNDGKASVTYQSPAKPSSTALDDNIVQVVMSPTGTDYANMSFSRNVTIRLARPSNPNPNGAPVPNFFFSPTQPRENEDVLFDASASTDADGRIVSYAWSFGDGRSGTGRLAFHSYEVSGSYRVTLTVTDDAGLSVTSDPSAAGAQVQVAVSQDPVASFTFSPSPPKVHTQIFFNASTSTVPAGREIVAYEWDFGDGAVGSGKTPSYSYATPGTRTVTLVVRDNTGRSHATTRQLIVAP